MFTLNRPDSFLTIFRQCRYLPHASSDFLTSRSLTLCNPQRRTRVCDTVSIRIPKSALAAKSDEKLLALFTKGFFGGWVFRLESWLLRLGVWKMMTVKFSGLESPQSARSIWSQAAIPSTTLLQPGDQLFRAFQVTDVSITPKPNCSKSYIDVGYGSDQTTFSGCHQFQVTRQHHDQDSNAPVEKAKEEVDADTVEFSMQAFVCNPQGDLPRVVKAFSWFHLVYARLLFTRAVQACIRGE